MPWRSNPYPKIAKFADMIAILLSLVTAYYCRLLLKKLFPALPLGLDFTLEPTHLIVVTVATTVGLISFSTLKAYSQQRFKSIVTELRIIATTVLIIGLAVSVSMFLFRIHYLPRTLIAIFLVVNFTMLVLEKLLLFYITKFVRKWGINRKKIIVAGTGEQSKLFIETARKNVGWGMDIIGLLTTSEEEIGSIFCGEKVIGSVDKIENVLREFPADEIIITISTQRFDLIRTIVKCCEREGIRVHLISDFFGRIVKHVQADIVHGLSIITMSMTHDKKGQLIIKRIIDILVSSFLLVLLSPLFLFITVMVKLTSKGPAFYEWNVIGFNRKPFKSWKFRTMVVEADKMKKNLEHLNEMEGPVFKIHNDPRITGTGRFLRRYSLDELPQLISVLKGDMSLVGPRPAGPLELDRYESWHKRKLSIKPGITCLWQVNGRNNISKFDRWVKLDLKYIDNWNLWLDIQILLKTVPTVLRGTGK